ncbi:glycosyltransferase family 39 protein [Candidatus Pelagibacter bacterium nBUS_44]|uniref:glycosyltransferase family 39 protein n=1 Tax=Candidatus Pelagibacter bacterium nBUS_44 TaxID=3374195 RepID=UPI003EB89A64
MTNNNRNINNIFYIFVTSNLIFWTLVPSIANHNLPLDTIEALAWGSNLDWGFNKHPPMSAFFPEVFYQIFGSQDWSYYLLSQIFMLISFFYVFKFSKEFFNNNLLGLISVLLIEAIYFYNFTTPEFNVNVCQLPFWSLTVYFSWKIYNSKEVKFSDCFLVGLFAAFGFLSKYLFVYLLASIDLLFIYLIYIKKDRKFDFKYLITLEVFLIILVPHLIWLNNNEFITITYGLARTGLEQSNLIDHIKFPLIFLLKQVLLLIPFLILVWLLVKKIKIKFKFKDKKLLFLLAINILPIILMFLTSVVTGSKVRTMWMTPFYLFFGTLFVYLFQAQINIKKLKPFVIGFIFFFFLSPILYSFVSISMDNKRTDYPGKEIAIKTQYAWDQQFNSKINVVYGNEWNAGNLSYHLQSRPVWEGAIVREKLDQLKDYMCLDNVCVGSK